MSQPRAPPPGSHLHRQHLSTINKANLKGEAGKAPRGNLYEISPTTTEQTGAAKKKPTGFSFGKSAAQKTAEMQKKEQQTYLEQMKQVSFCDDERYSYENYPAFPLVSFLPLLTRKTTASKYVPVTGKLRLPIPDTFVFIGKEEVKMWLITSEEGYLEKIETFTNRDIIMAIGRPRGQENVLTAVLKVKDRRGKANELSVLNTEDLKNIIMSPPTGDYVIQRFVQSKGPNPSLTRVVWRASQASVAYTLTGKGRFSDDTEPDFRKRFTVCTDVLNGCTVFKTSGAPVREPIGLTEGIVAYVGRQHGIKLSELVCDWIKDAADKWWFIQVKSLRVTPECLQKWKQLGAERMRGEGGDNGGESPTKSLIPRANKKQEYVRLARCKCCNMMHPPSELVHELTFKMIIQTINHLTHRGEKIEFFNRTDLKVRDKLAMTRVFKVCNSCYELYNAEKTLITVEKNFAKAVGIPLVMDDTCEVQVVPPERKPSTPDFEPQASSSSSYSSRSALSSSKSSSSSSSSSSSGTSSSALSAQNATTTKELLKAQPTLHLSRLLVCIYNIFNLPPGDYTLCYQLLGHTITQQFSTAEPSSEMFLPDSDVISSISSLNKFQVLYFVADQKSLDVYFKQQQQCIRCVILSGHPKGIGGTHNLPTKNDRDAAVSMAATSNPMQTQRTMNNTISSTSPSPNATMKSARNGTVAATTRFPTPIGTPSPSPVPFNSDGDDAGAASPLLRSFVQDEGGLPPQHSAAMSYVGEFPINITSFNPQLESSRMDFMINMERIVPDIIKDICPQMKATVAYAPCASSSPEGLAEMPLWEEKGIYIPHHSYFTCEPLPDEWVLLLPQNKAIQWRPMKFFPREGYLSTVKEEEEKEEMKDREAGGEDENQPFFTDDDQPLPVFRKHFERLNAKKKRPIAQKPSMASSLIVEEEPEPEPSKEEEGAMQEAENAEGGEEGEREQQEGGEGQTGEEQRGEEGEYAEVEENHEDDGLIPRKEEEEGEQGDNDEVMQEDVGQSNQ
ncbi:putative Lmbr1-like motif protein [Monocercomonoides exilis]|uniref:putative Lmbr1-like motif protein n=1 Tax=Monocercomonoides exilis TaxID=2049356 RepID=UPI0035595BD2|nr:putative Lmbr1-like motif protein [Monocercomonoides exilis]|eukprot:MONOS_7338.1-p1 / transcript=MONOS_7338.1 / gene=MONOS_7338 / organism=Monocercomonoides_exilis_PA203 / gene_product=Lmbr1-like motif protein / transcript_product=Lmbr1-like motif protein / location=Mono_scaffold00248:71063-74612(+) / protein_length=1013 / sequence_SO=supercontig / SO=protein_coding / is_pseudo=false